MNMENTKEELEKKLKELNEKERLEKLEIEKEKRYKRFLNRKKDEIVWFAHCDIWLHNDGNRWYEKEYNIGNAIYVSWNCWTSYNAKAPITSATHTYFHNVWTDKQRNNFQAKLNKFAIKEIYKIMDNLQTKLEIMGLQSDYYFLNSWLFPEDKIWEIKKELKKWQKEILDKYSDDEFNQIKWITLYHWWSIYLQYLQDYRKHLL